MSESFVRVGEGRVGEKRRRLQWHFIKYITRATASMAQKGIPRREPT
jgi:hypothetical protein